MNNAIPFPTAPIRPVESPTEYSLRGLSESYADMSTAIREASTVADAYALYRYLNALEQNLQALTTQAMDRMEQLERESNGRISK